MESKLSHSLLPGGGNLEICSLFKGLADVMSSNLWIRNTIRVGFLAWADPDSEEERIDFSGKVSSLAMKLISKLVIWTN